MGQANPKRFGGEPEKVAVAVEGESAGRCDLAKAGLVVPIENSVAETVRPFPGHLDGVGTVRPGGNDFDRAFAVNASQAAAGDDGFEFYHEELLSDQQRLHGDRANARCLETLMV